jgi:hypothetical protein
MAQSCYTINTVPDGNLLIYRFKQRNGISFIQIYYSIILQIDLLEVGIEVLYRI